MMTYVWKIMPLLATGPLKSTDFGCTDRNYVTSLLLLNNNFAGDDQRMCCPWYFYLSTDFFLYLFVHLLALLFVLSPRLSLASTLVLMASSLVYTAYYT